MILKQLLQRLPGLIRPLKAEQHDIQIKTELKGSVGMAKHTILKLQGGTVLFITV